MIFELIKVVGNLIVLAYMGNCSDLNGYDMPYSIDGRVYLTRQDGYCRAQYQGDPPDWMIGYDVYQNERQYRAFIRKYPVERIRRLEIL